jgi:hypothetical protein
VRDFVAEIGESALLGLLEPEPLRFTLQHERDVPRVRAAFGRARDGTLARLHPPVNRNAFLLGCLDATQKEPREHLFIGYGFRHGSTTKIDGVHHTVGEAGSVRLPTGMAYSMGEHFEQHDDAELLIFHNHPYNLINLLVDNVPLASRTDRVFAEKRTMNVPHLVRRVFDRGRVLFYVGENGTVKQFHLPSLVAFLQRRTAAG